MPQERKPSKQAVTQKQASPSSAHEEEGMGEKTLRAAKESK